VSAVNEQHTQGEAGAHASVDAGEPEAAGESATQASSESDALQVEIQAVRTELAAAEDRALRARAELDTLRRRQQSEADRAYRQGQDSALMPILAVHDDLSRALAAANQGADPQAILPGVEAVMAGLSRALEALGLTPTGAVGEVFDATKHEALMAVPVADGATPGTIQSVFELGFTQGDRLVRPARVVVYQQD
jgi:molecular chaperone GrpE